MVLTLVYARSQHELVNDVLLTYVMFLALATGLLTSVKIACLYSKRNVFRKG